MNGLIQNFGGTLSALGGAMYFAGSLSENLLMFGLGLGLEVYGNLMKEGNKWTAQNPTTFFDPFFQFVDKLTNTGEWIGQNLPTLFDIHEAVNTLFNAALNWRPPRDPLVLDLDRDGIEATAIDPNAPVLFDHDASGSRTASGSMTEVTPWLQ